MALSTYTELKAAIADWLWRSDLTSQIPDFVRIAEARFNREIRTPDMVNVAALTITDGVATVPTGYISALSMTLTGQSPYNKLKFQPADRVSELDPNNTGSLQIYTRIGDTFAFWPRTSGTARLWYRKEVDALDADTASNWLLTSHPDLYLYASLVAAEPFLRNEQRLPVWKSLADEAIYSINAQALAEQEDGVQILPVTTVV